jgi:succinyl-diaminopimelate desuccinylase
MWDKPTFERIRARIAELEPEMVEMQRQLVRRPAISPGAGGEGEKARVDYLVPLLGSWGLEVAEYRAPDQRAACGYRPSLVARLKGRRPAPALWIMAHLDIVPPGPRELWHSDPFEAKVADGRIWGRGVEDNQQELVASAYAVKAMLDLGLVPETDVCLMFVADEETGSDHGVGWLLDNHDLCRPEDLVLVPDAGNDKGTMIEIAEKSIAWVKFTTLGRQSHGSTPQYGTNALRAGAHLLLRLDRELHEKYAATDQLFSPPYSTLEPTKKEANVPNVNTIPGEDAFYFDCRMLPVYQLDDLLADMRRIAAAVAAEYKVEVKVETDQYAQAAPPTAADAPVVRALSLAVREVLGAEPFLQGIGGGTVAALFRRKGVPAVVWGCNEGQAHRPNEYATIAKMVGNAAVYAHLMGQQPGGAP